MSRPKFSQTGTAATITAETTKAVPLPATVVDGELAIMGVSCALDVTGTITWPAGWNEIGQDTQGGVDQYGGCAWKRLSAADGGTSPTVTFAAAQNGVARVMTITDALSVGTPIEAVDANKGTSASWDSDAIVTTLPDRLGVHVCAMARANATAAPSGWAERIDSGGGGAQIVMETKAPIAIGTEAATSRTITSDDWTTWAFAVLPETPKVLLAT